MDRFVRRRVDDGTQTGTFRHFVAAPGPNALLEDLPGFPMPPDWAEPYRHMIAAWRDAGIKAKILLPCAGIDGPGHALKNLGIPFHAYAWDTNLSVGPVLRRVHRSGVDARVGPVAGDVLRLPLASVPTANLLVAGPPCPPWSSLGVGDSFDDPRALVFWKVCDMIVDQATRERPSGWQHAFWAFILENVEGMLNVSAADRAEGNETSPMDEIVSTLQARLGEKWRLEVEVVHTSDGGLPQKRSRPYLRGVRKDLVDLSPLPSLPPSLLRGGYDLGALLRMDLPPTSKVSAGKGNKYMTNLAKYKIKMSGAMRDLEAFGTFAVVDLSRDLDREYGAASRCDNRAPCLTASNSKLWVFSLGAAPEDTPVESLPSQCLPIDRWLHPVERCTLQGFPPDLPIAVRDAVRVTGNAMSVPSIGRQMLPIFVGLSGRFL